MREEVRWWQEAGRRDLQNSVGGAPQEFYDEPIAQELLLAAAELIAYAEKGLSEGA